MKQFVAYHAPTNEYLDFDTREEASEYIVEASSHCNCGQKPCEAKEAEWFLLFGEDFEKAKTFKDIISASGFVLLEGKFDDDENTSQEAEKGSQSSEDPSSEIESN